MTDLRQLYALVGSGRSEQDASYPYGMLCGITARKLQANSETDAPAEPVSGRYERKESLGAENGFDARPLPGGSPVAWPAKYYLRIGTSYILRA